MARRRQAGESDKVPQGTGEEPTVIIDPASAASDGAPSVEAVREAASLLKDPVPVGAPDPGDGEGPGSSGDDAASATPKDRAKAAGDSAAAAAGDAAEQAKAQGRRARKKLSSAATGAKDKASAAASDARDRAAGADVHDLAKSTSGLIDNARPFFLAGSALLFAALGFFDGDDGTGQVFVLGSILFVLGAAFSTELTGLFPSRRRSDED